MSRIRIVCSRPGYRLAGITHPAHAVYDEAAFTSDQLEVIRRDPLQVVLVDLVGEGGSVFATLDRAPEATGAADYLASVDPRVRSAAAANYADPPAAGKAAIPVPGLPGAEQVVLGAVPEVDPALSALRSTEASIGTSPASPGALPLGEVPGAVVTSTDAAVADRVPAADLGAADPLASGAPVVTDPPPAPPPPRGPRGRNAAG